LFFEFASELQPTVFVICKILLKVPCCCGILLKWVIEFWRIWVWKLGAESTDKHTEKLERRLKRCDFSTDVVVGSS
jgi:hypothetical protein